jgi:hypothetical protein
MAGMTIPRHMHGTPFPIRTVTVGSGIPPDQHHGRRSRTFTAGRELGKIPSPCPKGCTNGSIAHEIRCVNYSRTCIGSLSRDVLHSIVPPAARFPSRTDVDGRRGVGPHRIRAARAVALFRTDDSEAAELPQPEGRYRPRDHPAPHGPVQGAAGRWCRTARRPGEAPICPCASKPVQTLDKGCLPGIMDATGGVSRASRREAGRQSSTRADVRTGAGSEQ